MPATLAPSRRASRTPAENCERIVKRIAEVTGEAWTFGYIGNLTPQHDDRGWFAFRPHPGRVGTAADRIGGNGTDDLEALVPVLSGALRMAMMLRG